MAHLGRNYDTLNHSLMKLNKRVCASIFITLTVAFICYVKASRQAAHGKALYIEVRYPSNWKTAGRGCSYQMSLSNPSRSGGSVLKDELTGQEIAHANTNIHLLFVTHRGFLISIKTVSVDRRVNEGRPYSDEGIRFFPYNGIAKCTLPNGVLVSGTFHADAAQAHVGL
jgi:hypothetical protein